MRIKVPNIANNRSMYGFVILSERKRVEGSSTFAQQYGPITGKILRLRASRSAQDDIRFCDSSVCRISILDSYIQYLPILDRIVLKNPLLPEARDLFLLHVVIPTVDFLLFEKL